MTSPSDPSAVDLGTFEGKQVLTASVEMPNAAGGLREPMQFDPKVIHHEDEGYLVLKYKARRVGFKPIPNTQALNRVVTLDITEGTFADEGDVAALLDAQRARVAEGKARAEAAEAGGVIVYPTDEELHADHQAGDHDANPIQGCVDCQTEAGGADTLADQLEAQAALRKQADEGDPAPDEYSELKGVALKDLCRERGLAVSGTAPQLRERLRASDVEGSKA